MNLKGEAGGFQRILIASVLIVLFAFMVLTWMFDFMASNNLDTTQIEDESPFSYNQINSSLEGVQGEADDLVEAFTKSEGEEVGILEGIFTVTSTFFTLPVKMISFIVTMFNLVIIDGLSYIFQNSAIGSAIVGVVAGIIIFGIIFGIIRILKAGD